MDDVLAWLGQNWWMGVAGIVAILALLVTIFKSGGDKNRASDNGVVISRVSGNVGVNQPPPAEKSASKDKPT